MATTNQVNIIHKQSSTTGNTPTLANGELGINLTDQVMWCGSSSGNFLINGVLPNTVPGGRISLSSTNAVVSSVTNGPLYYLPCTGNQIILWNTTLGYYQSVTIPDSGIEYVGSLTGGAANTNADVYVQNINGSPPSITLWWWSSNTSRGYTPVMINGMWFLGTGSNQAYRLVGTIRTNASNQSADTPTQRFCYNLYNQVLRPMTAQYTTGSTWSYTETSANTYSFPTGHAVNSSNANCVIGCVLGGPWGDNVFYSLDSTVWLASGAGGWAGNGVSLDQTGSWSSIASPGFTLGSSAFNALIIPAPTLLGNGYHFFTALDTMYCNGVSTVADFNLAIMNGWFMG